MSGEKTSMFDVIKTGLDEAIAHEKGAAGATTRKITIHPVDRYEPDEIRQIRLDTGMTQKAFANYMGVSTKAVEAWECGRNHPDGAACRLLWLTKRNPQFPTASGIVLQY